MFVRGVLVAVFTMAVSGCVVDPARSGQVPVPPPPTKSRPADPAGQRACDAIGTAADNFSADPVSMVAAGEAGATSSDPEITAKSLLVRDAARRAVNAITAGNEMEIAKTRIELGYAVSDLRQVCSDGGYLP